MGKIIEVMDTTLRDGLQAGSLAMTIQEKLAIASFLLTGVGVDRIEVASARTPKGEDDWLKVITSWAKEHDELDRIEVLGFVDIKQSADWIAESGCKVMNLLVKGAEDYCLSIGKTCDQHIKEMLETIDYCKDIGLTVNVYLEGWSEGVQTSWDYLKRILLSIPQHKVERVMLCDTMGILYPAQIGGFVKKTLKILYYLKVDVHMHDDYGLATANTLAGVSTGLVSGVHATVNSMGERAGNASLEQVVVGINDLTNHTTKVNELLLKKLCQMTSSFSGRSIPPNAPIAGSNIFVDGCGVHVHGRKKGAYATRLIADRFGSTHTSAISSLSGKSGLRSALENELGITTLNDREIQSLLDKVSDLHLSGQRLTAGHLLSLASEVLNQPERIVLSVKNGDIVSRSVLGGNAHVQAKLLYRNEEIQFESYGDGGFDAFMNGLKAWAVTSHICIPELLNFSIRIPPEGKTDALTEVDIRWSRLDGKGEFHTIGTSSDQVMASIHSAIMAVNVCNQNIAS